MQRIHRDGGGLDGLATLARIGVVLGLAALGGAGCAPMMRPVLPARVAVSRVPAPPPAPVAVPASPFADSPVAFFVRGLAVMRGEEVIVRVCVGADRSIVSSTVVQSSGDPRFDQLAVGWARQVRLRARKAQTAPHATPIAPCGAVRVQIPLVPDEPVTGARDSSNLLG